MGTGSTSVVIIVNNVPAFFDNKFKTLFHLTKLLISCGYEVSFASYEHDVRMRANWSKICSNSNLNKIQLFSLHEHLSGHPFPSSSDLAEKKTCERKSGATIDYLDGENNLVQRRIISETSGKVLKTMYFVPGEQSAYLIQLHDDEGKASSALWQNEDGEFTEFKTDKTLKAHWLESVINDVSPSPDKSSRPVVFIAADHACDRALLTCRNTGGNCRIISLIRNPLFESPFKFGAPLNSSRLHLRHLREYDAVMFSTQDEKHDAAQIYGDYPHMFWSHPAAYRDFHLSLPQKNNKNSFAVHASDASIQGAKDALNAFAQLAGSKEATLAIYCSKAIQQQLRDYAASRKLDAQQIQFFSGFKLAGEELSKHIAYLSIASRFGFDFRIAESLEKGTPVIAYDYCYGPSEVIRNGVNGFLVSYGDANGLADAMHHLLSSKASLRQMRKQCKTDAKRMLKEAETEWQAAILHVLEKPRPDSPVTPEFGMAIKRMQIAEIAPSNGQEASLSKDLLMKAEISRPMHEEIKLSSAKWPTVKYTLSIGDYSPENYVNRISIPGTIEWKGSDTDFVSFSLNDSLLEQMQLESEQDNPPFSICLESGKTKSTYSFKAKDVLKSIPDDWRELYGDAFAEN